MTRSTKWTVSIFVVVLAFALGTLFQAQLGQKEVSAQSPTNRVADTGWLGIGTTEPTAHLNIIDGSSAAEIRLDSQAGSAAKMRFMTYAGGDAWFQVGDAWESGRTAPFKISGMFGSPVHMTILGNGNIGIGTTTPAEKLDVQGDIKLAGNITSDGEICIGSGCP